MWNTARNGDSVAWKYNFNEIKFNFDPRELPNRSRDTADASIERITWIYQQDPEREVGMRSNFELNMDLLIKMLITLVQ